MKAQVKAQVKLVKVATTKSSGAAGEAENDIANNDGITGV